MKKLIILCLILSGCSNDNETTIQWINTHPKPIRCLVYGSNAIGETAYTLIDSNNIVYIATHTTLNLPDTIK